MKPADQPVLPSLRVARARAAFRKVVGDGKIHAADAFTALTAALDTLEVDARRVGNTCMRCGGPVTHEPRRGWYCPEHGYHDSARLLIEFDPITDHGAST